MSNVRILHNAAMSLAQHAMVARHEQDDEKAKILARKAYKYEAKAASLVGNNKASEPTRSILCLSAASLAYQAKEFEVAKVWVERGLSGHASAKLVEELKALHEQVSYEQRAQNLEDARKRKDLLKSSFKTDLLSGITVYLVSLPLCLGVALASGAPLFAGVISGVIGGIIVGSLSRSQLSVTGPAAGLTLITLVAISTLNSYSTFLLALALAGLMQIVLGWSKAGIISKYFPSNVIEGMLSAIGIVIILRQSLQIIDYKNNNWKSDLHPGVIIIALASLLTLFICSKLNSLIEHKMRIPGPLVTVIVGTVISEIFKARFSNLAIQEYHAVGLPVISSFADIAGLVSVPDISAIGNANAWVVAVTIAAVASIETLLGIEAVDRMDPLKRLTNTDAELQAQGFGNFFCGLVGGLPMTSVIVRSSVNVHSGAKTKISSIAQGCYMLVTVLTIPALLNKIPLVCFSIIMIVSGFKLAHPSIFKKMFLSGMSQFAPFMITVIAIVFTDLLKGVAIGLFIGIVYILKENADLAELFLSEKYKAGDTIQLNLASEVTLWNKKVVTEGLANLPEKSGLVINAAKLNYIDDEMREIIEDFAHLYSKEKDITVNLVGFKQDYLSRIEPRYIN